MKTCGCGKHYEVIPAGARAFIDEGMGGFYFNCSCNSTLFWSAKKHQKEFNLKVDAQASAPVQKAIGGQNENLKKGR